MKLSGESYKKCMYNVNLLGIPQCMQNLGCLKALGKTVMARGQMIQCCDARWREHMTWRRLGRWPSPLLFVSTDNQLVFYTPGFRHQRATTTQVEPNTWITTHWMAVLIQYLYLKMDLFLLFLLTPEQFWLRMERKHRWTKSINIWNIWTDVQYSPNFWQILTT